ncbi:MULTISPECIES: gas vesicle protein GvpJ [Natrialbaceae]|uniref:gas vesicle protein GvpJ n=1 Tax=Natrialbaceae TaxID=1644061 RepID=UPI003606BE8B
MPNDFQPSRQKADLAEVVEMLLDKGIVINADIAVSIGDTQLLGIQVRAAIASFETAAKYGLEFPEGTDMRRLAEAVDEPELAEMERPKPMIDATRGVNVTPNPEAEDGSESETEGSDEDGTIEVDRISDHLGATPAPKQPIGGGFNLLSDDAEGDEREDEADGESNEGENGDETTESDAEENER